MLELMRKHAGSWIIKIILGVIALAFALSFGVYSYFGQKQEVVLKVNDEPITMRQVRQELGRLTEEARRQLGDQFERLSPLLNLRQRALDRLVDQTLLFQAARRMGITVSNQELQRKVAAMPAFQRNGRFDLRLYQRALARSRLTPEKFEEGLRSELILQKLSTLVVGSVQVTPLEVDQELKRELTKVSGVYRIFDPDKFLDKEKVSDQEIKSYYESHRRLYLVPEKVVLSYITFPKARFRDKVDITAEDIQDAYDMDRGRYSRPERVRARHILIKLAQDASPAEVEAARKKAKEILALARKPGADFAALARKYSQGPTASGGGDLGYFKRGQMVPSFEKLAFKLKKGEVGMVRTRFGFHVVKVLDHQQAKVIPLDEVKSEIQDQLTEKMASELAVAAAENAFDQVAKTGDLAGLARKLKRGLNQTDPVVPGGQEVEGLPGLKGLAQAVEGLEQGQILPVMTYQDGAVVAVLKKRIPEKVKPLDEVKEEVRLAVRDQKAKAAARKAASDLLAKLAKEKDPAAVLAADKQARKTGWIPRNGSIEGLENSSRLVAALFERPLAKPVLPRPVEAGKGFAAAVLQGRRPPTPEEMAQKRKEVAARLLARKRRQRLQWFLKDLRSRAEIQTLVKL